MAVTIEPRLRLVVVGHVDHGKSTVIGRLFLDTGSLPKDQLEALAARAGGEANVEWAHVTDSLEEERERGITIDTTQAFFKSTARAGGSREYVIIDTPGHKQFLKNTFTGASRAEAALLLVDAAEGVRDQTKRHVNILRMIGLRKVVVALNKMDLVGFDEAAYDRLSADVRALLDGFDVKALVPVAARDGDNVVKRSERTGWYPGPTVLEGLDSVTVENESASRPLRLPVQDVLSVGGAGGGGPGGGGTELCVGRIESGRLAVGDEVVLRPSGRSAVLESIRGPSQEEVREAAAGLSVGFALSDGAPAQRGEVVCHEASAATVAGRLETRVFWLSESPLKSGARFDLRCATQETPCEVLAVKSWVAFADEGPAAGQAPAEEKAELAAGDLGSVTLAIERPIAVDVFSEVPQLGRLVIEKDGRTVGAGIVTAIPG